jgi:hypothetical protein
MLSRRGGGAASLGTAYRYVLGLGVGEPAAATRWRGASGKRSTGLRSKSLAVVLLVRRFSAIWPVDLAEQSSSDLGRDWERCTRCGTTRFVCAGAGGCPTSLPDGASSLPSWSRSSSSPSDRGSSRSIDWREGGPTRVGEGHSASGQCYAFSSFVGRRRAATRPMSPNAARTIIATA